MQRMMSGARLRPFVRVLVVVMAAVFGGVAGGAGGWLLGSLYGDTSAANFEFAGLRGYQATGLIGGLLGFILVAGFCALRQLRRPGPTRLNAAAQAAMFFRWKAALRVLTEIESPSHTTTEMPQLSSVTCLA